MSMKIKINYLTLILIIFNALIFSKLCYTADVLFIGPQSSAARQKIEYACRFYGLEYDYLHLNHLNSNKSPRWAAIVSSLKKKKIQAIVIAENALCVGNREIWGIINEISSPIIPVLFLDLSPESNQEIFSYCSLDTRVKYFNYGSDPSSLFYKINHMRNITKELAGQKCTIETSGGAYFYNNNGHHSIIDFQGNDEKKNSPFFFQLSSIAGNCSFKQK